MVFGWIEPIGALFSLARMDGIERSKAAALYLCRYLLLLAWMWLPFLTFAYVVTALCWHANASEAPSNSSQPALPAKPYSYAVTLPPHLSQLAELDATPDGNPTDAGATLGRVLFHDAQLSRNGLVSCASCHTQAFGFDDLTRLSIGFEGRTTRRAAMTLLNARYAVKGLYFRDQRAASLEQQVLEPFTDPIEMGLAAGELVRRVQVRAFYPPLFTAAFGDPAVTEERIAAALAQYVRAIVSTRSRYDEARVGAANPLEPFPGFNAAENRGKHLFFTGRSSGGAGCSACHATEGFMMLEPKNNGLETAGSDGGVGEITGLPHETGLFRAATLKAVAMTAPYMHDGRFATLEAVIDHYSSGIKPHPNLSPELKNEDGGPANLNLSHDDKAALVAFLNTLTDEALLADPRFSDPFIAR